ncbi:glycosyltransferase family 2 protein [Pantoea sp. MBD-2R]|uniref:glycosyltransferase family 2 protein n=1 Tax=Pantoea sp. MBD-2R TaxID=3141540 RepID=UPI003183FA6A
MNEKILAITVTWQPVIKDLSRQVAVLLNSNVDVVIVDNGSENVAALEAYISGCPDNVSLLKMQENLGIAAAQNHGITRAMEQGYAYVLLMDQDSLPAENMVEELVRGFSMLTDAAAIGPNFTNGQKASQARFIRVEGLSIIKMAQNDSSNIVEVDHLIASGSLIPVRALAVTGLMDASLFIDYVDIEWALRARAKGLRSYGCFSAQMHHALGDNNIAFMGRNVAVHSPQRHYYMVRNAILLYKRKFIPVSWKIVDCYKLAIKMTILLLFAGQRFKNIKAIIRGCRDGINSKSGKCELK